MVPSKGNTFPVHRGLDHEMVVREPIAVSWRRVSASLSREPVLPTDLIVVMHIVIEQFRLQQRNLDVLQYELFEEVH